MPSASLRQCHTDFQPRYDRKKTKRYSTWQALNLEPQDYKACALPLCHIHGPCNTDEKSGPIAPFKQYLVWGSWLTDIAKGGSIPQWLAYLLPDPAALGSIPIVSNKKLSTFVRLINGAGYRTVYGQWLENADQTHLVLVSGKQKNWYGRSCFA